MSLFPGNRKHSDAEESGSRLDVEVTGPSLLTLQRDEI